MYPHRDLMRLAAHKAALQRRIALHRTLCAAAAVRATQPLAWLDRILAFWRGLSPFAQVAAVPLGYLLRRSFSARPRVLGTLLRWTPLLFGALRGLAGMKSR